MGFGNPDCDAHPMGAAGGTDRAEKRTCDGRGVTVCGRGFAQHGLRRWYLGGDAACNTNVCGALAAAAAALQLGTAIAMSL